MTSKGIRIGAEAHPKMAPLEAALTMIRTEASAANASRTRGALVTIAPFSQQHRCSLAPGQILPSRSRPPHLPSAKVPVLFQPTAVGKSVVA